MSNIEFQKGDEVKWFWNVGSMVANYGVVMAVREASCTIKCSDGEKIVVAKKLLNFD